MLRGKLSPYDNEELGMCTAALALYTGGKDSHYALLKALHAGVKVQGLVTVTPRRSDSWMFHTVNVYWTKLHSELLGCPQIMVGVSGVKEVEVYELYNELRKVVKDVGVDCLISGAVLSRYQKKRVDMLSKKLRLSHYAPLWGYDPLSLLGEEVKTLGFIVTAIQAYGLRSYWLGRRLLPRDIGSIERLQREYGINPVGEGGEFETLVITSPLFRGRGVCINRASILWYPHEWRGYYLVEDASICP